MNYLKKGKELNPLAPLGLQDTQFMNTTCTPKDKFLISITIGRQDDKSSLNAKESLLVQIGSMFICSSVIIAEEMTESYIVYHVLMGLASPLLWRNVDACIRKSWKSCNVIPTKSSFQAIRYLLSVDQVPLFWNFSQSKALRMIELMRMKSRYIHLDVPDTGDVTKGPPGLMNAKEKYKREQCYSAEQAKAPTNEAPDHTSLTTDILPPHLMKNNLPDGNNPSSDKKYDFKDTGLVNKKNKEL